MLVGPQVPGGLEITVEVAAVAVTQDDVANRAGVSRALVSLVMRDSPRVSEAKRQAVRQAAAELGYRPNVNAAQLARQRAMILGVVVTELSNPLFFGVLAQVEAAADQLGYAVLPVLGEMTGEHEMAAVDRLLGYRVDGILLVGTRLPASDIQTIAHQIPTVVIGRKIPGVDSVAVDSRLSGRMATEHLIELGHRRIVHVDGGANPGCASRRQGYQDAMTRAGLSTFIDVIAGDGTEASGVAAARTVLARPEPPTAVFAANDLAAMGILAVAKQGGVRVPDDLSVVGFDDTPLSSLRYVDLTSIAQPVGPIAASAVQALVERIAENRDDSTRSIKHGATLSIRGSSGPAPPERPSIH